MRAKCNAAQTNFIKEDFVQSQPNWKILILYLNNTLKWGVLLSPGFSFTSYLLSNLKKQTVFFSLLNQKKDFKEYNGRDGQQAADETKHLLYEAVLSSVSSLLCTWNMRQQLSDLLLAFINLLIQPSLLSERSMEMK